MRALRREAPLLLLLLYGGAFAYAAFGRGVPAFDDHPGQLFRLWHALDRSLPSAAWTADWNPDWWGGYPELQFYPPGLALVGALVRVLLLWQPSVETVYRLLCALILLAPGITTYALLARVVGDRWLRPAGSVPRTHALRGSPGGRGGRAPLGHSHDPPRPGLAAAPRARAAALGRGRPDSTLGAAARRPGDPVPPVDAPVGGRPPRPRGRALAPGSTRAADDLAGRRDGGPHPRS